MYILHDHYDAVLEMKLHCRRVTSLLFQYNIPPPSLPAEFDVNVVLVRVTVPSNIPYIPPPLSLSRVPLQNAIFSVHFHSTTTDYHCIYSTTILALLFETMHESLQLQFTTINNIYGSTTSNHPTIFTNIPADQLQIVDRRTSLSFAPDT